MVLALIGTMLFSFAALKTDINNYPDNCVTVYVDYNGLNTEVPAYSCISISETIKAKEVVFQAGYDILGTQKYPDLIVCRVNNLPAPDKEKCFDMPPADAYWAILIEKNGKWKMAQVGIADIELKAGEGIGLVYVNQGKIKYPN